MASKRTPTLFVNGRRIVQAMDWPNLKAIIDNEIEYQKTAKNAGEDCGCDTEVEPARPAASQQDIVTSEEVDAKQLGVAGFACEDSSLGAAVFVLASGWHWAAAPD